MIVAQGAHISLTSSVVHVRRLELAAALAGSVEEEISFSQITGVKETAPTSLDSGVVIIERESDSDFSIVFAPNQQEQARNLTQAIEQVLAGKIPALATADASSSSSSDAKIEGLRFVALDVETANRHFGSVCQIGLTRVEDGQITETQTWLCQPPAPLNYFEPANVAIHKITPEQVADEPAFADVMGEVLDFIGEDSFLAHNAQFDATALRDAAAAAEFELPALSFGCSLALARTQKLRTKNHKLPTLAAHFGHELDNHHDAGADAAAAAAITLGLARQMSHTGSFMDLIHKSGFTLGVISEGAGRITPVLKDRSGAGRKLQAEANAPVSPSVGGAGTDFRSSDTLFDASPTTAESPTPPKRGRPAPWDAVATPDVIPESNEDADPQAPLFGENVTLTGDFEPFDKGHLWNLIASQGGTVGKNVTKKTTILVAGSWATKTSKEKRAEELQEKGQDIAIWNADQLLEALGLNEAPPF